MAKKYIRCHISQCISIWQLVSRWKNVPPSELGRVLDEKELQIYKNAQYNNLRCPEVVFLYPYNRNIIFIYEDMHIYSLHTEYNYGAAPGLPYNYVEDNYGEDTSSRFFFLLSEVERMEIANPEYLDPMHGITMDKTNEQMTNDSKDNGLVLKGTSSSSLQEVEILMAKIEAKQSIISRQLQNLKALQAENEVLKSTIDRQEKELAERPDAAVVNNVWRKEWGFLDYVITMIESGMSRDSIAKKLNKQGYSGAITRAVIIENAEELQALQASKVIIGAVTSEDKAIKSDNALRTRARKLIKK